MIYQLERRATELCRLCVSWERAVRAIPPQRTMPESWGPSAERLRSAASSEYQPSWEVNIETHEDDEDSCGLEFDDERDDMIDEEVLESIETLGFIDAHHDGEVVGVDIPIF